MSSERTAPPVNRPVRVQRLVDVLHPVHLEAEIPAAGADWSISVDGLVTTPLEVSLELLREMPATELASDFHCVWGWSKRSCRWRGVSVGDVLDEAGAAHGADFVTVSCRVPPYASCMRMEDARLGLLAWELDGESLAPEHGWPVRFVAPAWLWGYKSVKWVGGLSVGNTFAPGFWEDLVGDPQGRIPPPLLAPFDKEEDA